MIRSYFTTLCLVRTHQLVRLDYVSAKNDLIQCCRCSGLSIFFIMPTTLSSGVILTRAAKGNFALALLLTVATNLAAILLIPLVMQVQHAIPSLVVIVFNCFHTSCVPIIFP